MEKVHHEKKIDDGCRIEPDEDHQDEEKDRCTQECEELFRQEVGPDFRQIVDDGEMPMAAAGHFHQLHQGQDGQQADDEFGIALCRRRQLQCFIKKEGTESQHEDDDTEFRFFHNGFPSNRGAARKQPLCRSNVQMVRHPCTAC